MNSIIKSSIKRSVTVCVLIVVLMAVGVLATLDMSTNLLPNIKLPMMGISIVYPGASAQSVNDGVTQKVEKALQTIPGITDLETISYDNASVAILTFDYGTDIDDKIAAIQDCFKSVTFPEGCLEPNYIKIDMNGTATATISVYNAEGNLDALTADANALAARLNGIEGVGSVNVFGTAEKQVRITALQGLDLTALLIVNALQNENLNIPLGTIMQDGTTVAIRNATDATSLLQIMQLPVSLQLGASSIATFATLQQVVKTFAGCTSQQLEDYLQQALDAKDLMDEIENSTAEQLEEKQQGLTAVKSLMTLLRQNSSDSLNTLGQLINDDLKDDWNKLVAFREIYPDEITYDNFAYLFQDGNPNADTPYEGLGLLPCADYTHEQAVETCEFADSINTLAFQNIVETVRQAEQNGETAHVTDAQFSALLMLPPQIIHLIRQDNFYVQGDDTCIVNVLRLSKQAHVNVDGNPVYRNGVEVVRDDNGNQIVEINNKVYFVNRFGRLTDKDGNLVDDNGNLLNLTDNQKAENYYTYGNYIVYTDAELVELYHKLNITTDFGVTVTEDVVRLARICNFADNADNLIVPLAYIGHVTSYENKQAYSQHNGLMSVTIEVYAVADASTTKVVDEVRKILRQFDGTSAVTLLDDKAEFINDSVSNVLSSIIIGGVLAVLIIFLFVRKVGSSLVISITMPLSVLCALVGLWLMKISLNLVSLGGLAVGIGMLVDNSIVVLESITKRRDKGESVFDSCLNGTREVAGSLLASTLTNVCVFFPILFARGLTREIFYDLVWAVLFSIVMSLIVAVTVIPSLYHLIYKNSPRFRRLKNKDGNLVAIDSAEANEPRAETPAEPTSEVSTQQPQVSARKAHRLARRERIKKTLEKASISRLEEGYGNILSKILTKRVLVCVLALVLFGASVALVFTTGTEFMPSVDKGVIEVDVAFDASVSLEQATDASVTIADQIRTHYGDKLQYVSLTVGKQGLLATSHTGVIRIQTDVKRLKTSATVQEIRQMIPQNSVIESVTVREMDGAVAEVTGGMSGQSVALLSNDVDVLRQAAAVITEKLLEADPTHIVSAVNNTAQLSTQISFTFNRTACAERGVDYQMAVMLLRVGMSGYTATTVNIDGESQDVTVQFEDATRGDLNALLDVVVGMDDDGAVKLRDVLTQDANGNLYTVEQVATTIHKKNGKYYTSIDLEIYDIDSGTIGKTINKTVNEVLQDFGGVEFQEGGVASYLSDAFKGLIISLIAAFVLLYSVMACQFESLVKPFIVIMSIPFSFTGGFLALAITGITLNVVSFVGIIMLMGVIVNGAIVMIDKINMLIKEGMDPRKAVIEGCKSRLRAILMTTLTTILALVPLALGLGRGGELMQPMGVVVLGGLLLGTLVTLVLIPCFYCIVKRISFRNKPTDNNATTDGANL